MAAKGLLNKTPKVALFLATNEKAGRDKLQGILRYVRLHTPWTLHLIENRIGEQQLGDLRAWGATGVIVARMPESVHAVSAARVPTLVMDSPALYSSRLPEASYVTCDSTAIGEAGAEYFIKQGFKNFAYVADTNDWDWSIQRQRAFTGMLAQAGHTCHVYGTRPAARGGNDWALDQKCLLKWLRSLPKPTALLAARDGRARQVLETCGLAGLNVPGDIAILGIDNEDILCENTVPTLSSIQPDFEDGGYQSAHILEQLMRGTLRKPQNVYYGVKQIVLRSSSRNSFSADHRLLRGVEFIRLNACTTVSVPDIVAHMRVSRRMAELLFRKHLGHSIHDEIQQIRLARLKAFLLETACPIGLISEQCGFQTDMHAKRVFKQLTGQTMRQFRKAGGR